MSSLNMESIVATVYRVLPEDKYQTLETNDPGESRIWPFDGTPIGDKWHAPAVYAPSPNLMEPDIWNCFLHRHVFAFNEKAGHVLQTFLDQATLPTTTGEQLALYFRGKKLIVLNVTYVLNCLDSEHSKSASHLRPRWITEYVFIPGRFEYSLFMIPETQGSELLTVEGLAAPEEEFKPMVEKHGLKGLRFEKLWWDGPVPKC